MRSPRPKRRKRKSEGAPLCLVLGLVPCSGERTAREGRGTQEPGNRREGRELGRRSWQQAGRSTTLTHPSLFVHLSQTAHAHRI